MNRKVLRRRDDLKIFRIVTLQSRNEGHSHASGEVWIFTVRFLATPPARITEDIDIRRPEIQPLVDVPPAGSNCLGVLGPRFATNSGCHLMNQGSVEAGSEANWLRKHSGGPSACDTM